jgi:tryptophan halogenase
MPKTHASAYNPIRKILIVGGGTAGWMAAAALIKDLANAGPEIQLVESPEIGTIGVGEATIPFIHKYISALGLDQADFVRNTNATFKLGIRFRDWGSLGEDYIHPFSYYGQNYKNVAFYQLYSRFAELAIKSGHEPSLEDFSIGCYAARNRRFRHPLQNEDFGVASFSYAFHFDASLFAQYLKKFSIGLGVKHLEGKVVDVAQRPTDGFISSVKLADGRELEADLFIDCTGMRGLLIEKALKSAYEDWQHWLPCNRAIAIPCAPVEPPVPFTQAFAEDSGWRWRIPLQHRTGNGVVYSSAFEGDDSAVEDKLLQSIDGAPLASPNRIKFTPGRRREVWVKNCIAVGLASGFIEPLESTNIHLIQSAIFRLLLYFPDRNFNQIEIDSYNREADREIENIRDFVMLHYKVTEREDTPFWKYCKYMSVPETLQTRIDMFKAHGRIPVGLDEFFSYPSWLSVLHGQGLRPEAPVPQAAAFQDTEIASYMNELKGKVDVAVGSMPTHAEYLSAFCAPRPGHGGPAISRI